MSKESAIRNFQKQWPSFSAFARSVGVSDGTAQQWRIRDAIPPEHWPAVVAAAEEDGVEGVSIEYLHSLYIGHPQVA